jgi:hypothetical protein
VCVAYGKDEKYISNSSRVIDKEGGQGERGGDIDRPRGAGGLQAPIDGSAVRARGVVVLMGLRVSWSRVALTLSGA